MIGKLIRDLIEAQRNRDKCYESCDHSPGYFCHREQSIVDKIELDIAAEIEHIVDERVKVALEGRT